MEIHLNEIFNCGADDVFGYCDSVQDVFDMYSKSSELDHYDLDESPGSASAQKCVLGKRAR